jgi:hypothetical protein
LGDIVGKENIVASSWISPRCHSPTAALIDGQAPAIAHDAKNRCGSQCPPNYP